LGAGAFLETVFALEFEAEFAAELAFFVPETFFSAWLVPVFFAIESLLLCHQI
jgi:hypothetical protein